MDLQYQSGFGNHFSTEAVPGALPLGQNSPQKTPFGLYAEQLSGSAFTAPRHENRRSWLYRLRPSAGHGAYRPYEQGRLKSGPFDAAAPTPNRLRWDPLEIPSEPTDFVDGLVTVAGNGDVGALSGMAVHLYLANRSMQDRAFYNADGEMLLVPQQGVLRLVTEFGILEAGPGHIAVIPRGVRFRVELDGPSRGYVCEVYGAPFKLPDLGPIGANGLANPRDFQTPVAAFEDVETPTLVIQKYQGALWAAAWDHSPLDVVAWHGNLAPYRYDLALFNTINTVSYDHPDPSIFTVLTAPSEVAGTANVDFVIFPPRWMVAEDTFRPPWFHRNVMSEYMGLCHGAYEHKAARFPPGGGRLATCMSDHGPDVASHQAATEAVLAPHKLDQTLAFMFESRWPIRPTKFALETSALQADYDSCWSGFPKAVLPE